MRVAPSFSEKQVGIWFLNFFLSQPSVTVPKKKKKNSMPPLPSSSLLFANALGPVCSRRSHASLQPLPPPCCRRSAGESSSSSPSSSSSSSISASRRRSRPNVDAKASSTPPPPPNNARSFDGEDELDSVVSAELAQYIDPERAKQEQKRLELAWAVRAKVISLGFVETTRQFEGRFFFFFFFKPSI